MALGTAALADDVEEARVRVHAALALQIEADLIGDVPDTLEALAALALELGDAPVAAHLLGAAVAARRELGCVAVPSAEARLNALCDHRRQLGYDHKWADEFSRGEELSLAEALAYSTGAPAVATVLPRDRGSLTPTEAQVVELASPRG